MSACFFLRGLIREAGHWSGFLERFERAFPGVRAIPLEIPGNGARFREKSPLTISAMAEATREDFLRQRSGNDHLFALSLGGMIGLEWMNRWPEDFRSATLVNSSVRGLSPLYQRLRPRNYPRIFRMLLTPNLAFRERNILAMTSSKALALEGLARDWQAVALARPVSTRNALRQLFAAARFRPSLSRPPIPTLVLSGAQDQLVDPRCSKAIAEAWGLPHKIHPTAGHDLTLDEPEWVLKQLEATFLS